MKKVLILAVFMAIAIVPVFAENTVEIPCNQIQIGKFVAADPKLSSGIIGERSILVPVKFLTPFKVKPDVVVALTFVDSDKSTNFRINITADQITKEGFNVIVKTWYDSKVYHVEGTWTAVAPASTVIITQK